eukprot:TRINITY_DN3014_c0_g3_i2.p2 TRINITY_DN3014_c0_g3~~TRINITY_DN3014_c0_g3_i2.p2  ORF type:complete len:113 (-),score=37.88 TRINITY_DN3014_c0_g3_i2:369-707(-)
MSASEEKANSHDSAQHAEDADKFQKKYGKKYATQKNMLLDRHIKGKQHFDSADFFQQQQLKKDQQERAARAHAAPSDSSAPVPSDSSASVPSESSAPVPSESSAPASSEPSS